MAGTLIVPTIRLKGEVVELPRHEATEGESLLAEWRRSRSGDDSSTHQNKKEVILASQARQPIMYNLNQSK